MSAIRRTAFCYMCKRSRRLKILYSGQSWKNTNYDPYNASMHDFSYECSSCSFNVNIYEIEKYYAITVTLDAIFQRKIQIQSDDILSKHVPS